MFRRNRHFQAFINFQLFRRGPEIMLWTIISLVIFHQTIISFKMTNRIFFFTNANQKTWFMQLY